MVSTTILDGKSIKKLCSDIWLIENEKLFQISYLIFWYLLWLRLIFWWDNFISGFYFGCQSFGRESDKHQKQSNNLKSKRATTSHEINNVIFKAIHIISWPLIINYEVYSWPVNKRLEIHFAKKNNNNFKSSTIVIWMFSINMMI